VRQHGTLTCYRWGIEPGSDGRKGCRCRDCTTAAVIYEKQRQRRVARGERPYQDNTEAREHLLWLSANNVGSRAVSRQTGIGRTAIERIRRGEITRSRPETIEKIMSVGTHKRAGGALVDAAPTWRLIDDMLRYGFTKTYIAARLGSTAKRPALQIKREMVEQSTADAVAELHAELVGTVRDIQKRRMVDYRRRKRAEGAA
jgi:hypothetical protein